MSSQAKLLCVKTIFHLCLLYPYLVQIMDEFVFERFRVSVEEIESFANQLYEQEIRVKNFDAICFSLFFAIKYGFSIKTLKAQDAIESGACVFKLLAFEHFKRDKNVSERTLLRSHAIELRRNNEDFDRNWLFVFETLPQSELYGDWKDLKQHNISFIKREFSF